MKDLFKKIILGGVLVMVLFPPKAFTVPAFADVNLDNVAPTQLNDASCNPNWLPGLGSISCHIAKVSAFILSLAANLASMAGTLFDYAIDYSLNMTEQLNDFKFVSIGWAVLRDVTNLGYIFILLFIAINIILGNSGYGDKSLIAKVLITAVFVNFSLFGAKVIVDATNIAALQFYNLITPAEVSNSNGRSITGHFMNLFNLQSIYAGDGWISRGGVLAGVATAANPGITDYSQSEVWWRITKLCVFGTIFILAVTVVFFAGGFLFISRTIVIFFLMLFASLAVASRALPATKGQFDSWLKKLINNAIFAPIFLGLIYIFVSATSNNKGGVNLAEIVLGKDAGIVNISGLVIFFMYLAFLVGLLLIAKQLGVKGGDTLHGFADKWISPKAVGSRALGAAKGVGGASLNVGKNALIKTGGRMATSFAESGLMKNISSKIPRAIGGGYLRRGLASVGKATGYEKVAKADAADLKKEHEYLAKTASKDPQRKKWAQERANSIIGIDKNGEKNKLLRFLGGKGTADTQDAISKKQKAEAKKDERKRLSTVSTIEGVEKITGINGLIKKDVTDPNNRSKYEVDDKRYQDISDMASALEGEADIVEANNKLLLGGVEINKSSPLGMAAQNYGITQNKDDKNELDQIKKLLKSKLKTWKDYEEKEADKTESDEKSKKDDSSKKDEPKK